MEAFLGALFSAMAVIGICVAVVGNEELNRRIAFRDCMLATGEITKESYDYCLPNLDPYVMTMITESQDFRFRAK